MAAPSPLRRSETGRAAIVAHRAGWTAAASPWWAWASPEVCAAAHNAGMHVDAWGMTWPPRREEVEALVRSGVDSLDANDPRELRKILLGFLRDAVMLAWPSAWDRALR